MSHFEEKSFEDDSVPWGRFLVIGGIIVGAIIALTIAGYWVDRTYFYPQIRQNTIENPDRSIANRQFFHQELASIQEVDQQIDAARQALSDFQATHPRPWDAVDEQQYNNDEQELTSLLQIRQADIADYNAASTNPDKGRDRDACLPKTIDPNESVAVEERLLAAVSC